jgi:hypothetical protein
MSIATDILEDRKFVKELLENSRIILFNHRKSVENALDEASIKYHQKG